jgi:hypothetical protein
MTRALALAVLLAALPSPARAAPARHGVAAQHRTLDRVARVRGMSAAGVLFASPIDPIGAIVCVTSARHPGPICGRVVDTAQPRHRAWQIRTGRIVEVQPAVARLLCRDPSGPPRQCAVTTWREP